jgi:hypothetical protein
MSDKDKSDIFKAQFARAKEILKEAEAKRNEMHEIELKITKLRPKDPVVFQNLKDKLDAVKKDLDGLGDEYSDLTGEQLKIPTTQPADADSDALNRLADILQKNPRENEMCQKLANLFSFQQVQTIPQFSGRLKEKSVLDWFKQAEKIATATGWDDSEKLRFFSSRLVKPASDFHEQLVKDEKADSYNLWKKYLIEGFMDDIERDQARIDLESLKQKPDQRIRDFAKEIDDLYAKAYGTEISEATEDLTVQLRDREKKRIFLAGMRDAIYKRLVLYAPKDKAFDVLITLAQTAEEQVTWEKLTPNKELDSLVANVSASLQRVTMSDDDSLLQGTKVEVNAIDSRLSRKQSPSGPKPRDLSATRSKSRSVSRGRDNIRSFDRRKQGKRDFPNKNFKTKFNQFGRTTYNNTKKVRFEIECFKCHKKGHYARECRSTFRK